MVKIKGVKEMKQDQISFRVSGEINDRLTADANELNISTSQFARNIIMRYYQQKDARALLPPSVHESARKYSDIDRIMIDTTIKEALDEAMENIVLSDEFVDNFLDKMSVKALERLGKKDQ